jgi:hypothetical protein
MLPSETRPAPARESYVTTALEPTDCKPFSSDRCPQTTMKRHSTSGSSIARRSISRHSSSGGTYPPQRPPSPPSQTYHPSHLPRALPTTALLESLAGASHYSGIRVEPDATKPRQHPERRASHAEVKHDHQRAIFERSWHIDAAFEVRRVDNLSPSLSLNSASIQDPLSKCKGFREYAAQVSCPCLLNMACAHSFPCIVVCAGEQFCQCEH